MNLPNVFQNRNIGNINNDQEIFYGNKETIPTKPIKKIDINQKIKQLFQSKNYVYKLNVSITTDTNTFDSVIIGKSNNNLITIDNELIPIKNIIDINEK